MPGAYRYSATFDRTYEEDPPPTLNEQSQGRSQHSPTRRSLSSNGIHHRSASIDSLDSMFGSSGSSTGHSRQVSFDNAEHIPTRMVKKVTAKPAHNPLQFVKVASCPLSRKEMQTHLVQSSGSATHSIEAEELAKKKPEHKEKIKDEEEEWQSNLDNWKSRRRKQSEGALLRLEEIRRIEMEEQQRQQEQKKTKTKTFSEMMEERAQRPKQYNLHIYSRRASESVLSLEHDFGNCSFSKADTDNSSCDKESSDSTLCDSTVEEMMDNERQGSSDKGLSESRSESKGAELAHRRHSTGGNNQINYNRIEKHLSEINENELEKELEKEKLLSSGGYTNTDSGLDSLSSSHKTGDIADSASDFSQDSGSSLDSDFHHTTGSLTTGVELLEEFSSRVQSFSENVMPNYEQKGGNGLELFLRIWLKQGSENKDFGFVLKGGCDQNVPVVDSVIPGGVGDQAGLRKNDQILAINGECTQDIKQEALSFVVQQASYTGHLDLVIWRAFNNSDCNAQENSSDTLKQICSEDIHPKQSSESVEKRNSLVSHRKSSFEGEPKQKSVIQRTNKDIKPAINFKEKVSSFERRSSADECSTLVSKQVSSKLRPPVPAKPPQLQSNGESNSTSPNSKCTDNKLSSCEEKLNIVDTSEKETNKNKTNALNVSNCETDSNKVLPKVTSKDSECDSKTLYIENAQQSAKDASLNSEHSVNQLTKSNFNSKPNQLPLQNCENEEKYQPQRLIDLQPICNESGLNIIYDSHPEQNTQEANRVQSNPSSPEIEMKSKSKLVSQTCTEKTDAGKIDSKKSSSDKIEINSVVHNKSSNELKEEGHTADELKQQHQSQEDVIKQQYDLNTDLYNIPLNLSHDDILLADLDNSHRKIEPPKEKPPPPPPDESDVESSEKPPVVRANSTKEIKRELWKRRSDFLGIEFENGPIEVDESQLPCPLAIEDILKSERELEREKRQLLEQQTMLRLRRIAEEEEIARKEREIIENIEREERERQQQAERERQQQALEMEAALIHEREHPVSANEMSHSGNKKDVEINGIQQPKKKKNEKILEIPKPCLQLSNSVNRIKNELPAQGKERHIRRQQDADSSKVSKQQPIQGDNEIKQSNTNSETQASQNNSSVKSENKAINNSSSNKTPTKKMIMRQERERLRREQEDLQKQDSHILQKHQKAMQASKQGKPNGVHQDIVPNRIANDQSSYAQISNNPWDREDIIYASRHPEAAPTESKFENNVETESGNQELPLHSKPLSKHNLHSLGAAPKAKVLTNEQWMKSNEKVAKRRTETAAESGYNQYHWLVQEAEIRRIAEQKERQYQHSNEHRSAALPPPPSTVHPNNSGNISNGIHRNQYQIPSKHPPTHCALPFGHPFGYDVPRKNSAPGKNNGHSVDKTGSPTKPPRSSSREQLLSVSGRKRCSHCGNELGRGAAMIIESLQLFYHIQCFCCCVCQAQLGNGSCGTDVRVRNNKLHCQHCYSNDEAGLKFSQV